MASQQHQGDIPHTNSVQSIEIYMDQSDDNNSSDENSQGTRSGVVTGSGLRPRPWNVTATESQDETRSLLLPEQEPFPRYMTSSPIPSAQIRLDTHLKTDGGSLSFEPSTTFLS